MKFVRIPGAPGFDWPTKLELGAEVISKSGRRLKVTFMNTQDGTVWLED